MWSEQRIKPLLLHEDLYVREMALRALTRSWSRDPETANLALQGFLKYGFDARSPNLYFNLERLPLDESAFELLLECLNQPLDWRAAPDFNSAAARAPLPILEAREAELLACRSFNREMLETIQRRRVLAGWSGGRLWRELQDIVKRNPKYLGEWATTDRLYASLMIEALATHNNIPDPETIRRKLRAADLNNEGMAWILMKLAAERGLDGVSAMILEKVDQEIIRENEAASALIRIAEPNLPSLIRPLYPTAETAFKCCVGEVLSAIRTPESEAVLLEILDLETDSALRSWHCLEACSAFSESCAKRVAELVISEWDEKPRPSFSIASWHTVKECILPSFELFGIPLPQIDQWREERERNRNQPARSADNFASAPFVWNHPDSAHPPFTPEKPASFSTPAEHHNVTPPTPTIRNHAPKIGRNDPCPCGSGKKHKKCCGANS